MIPIEDPSVALNAYDPAAAAGYNAPLQFELRFTRDIPRGITPAAMAAVIGQMAQHPICGGHINTLVISCHGTPGFLQIGTGISASNVGDFAALRGKIDRILLRACLVARIQTPPPSSGAAVSPGLPQLLTGTTNGGVFCQRLADTVRCEVTASTELQGESDAYLARVGRQRSGVPVMPFGYIDDWDGLVLRFRPGIAPAASRFRSVFVPDPRNPGRIIAYH